MLVKIIRELVKRLQRSGEFLQRLVHIGSQRRVLLECGLRFGKGLPRVGQCALCLRHKLRVELPEKAVAFVSALFWLLPVSSNGTWSSRFAMSATWSCSSSSVFGTVGSLSGSLAGST